MIVIDMIEVLTNAAVPIIFQINVSSQYVVLKLT